MAYLLVDIDGVHRHVSQALIVNRMIEANDGLRLASLTDENCGVIYHAIQHAGLHSMQDSAGAFLALAQNKVNIRELCEHCIKHPETAAIAIKHLFDEADFSQRIKDKLAQDYRRFSVPQTHKDMVATPFHHLKAIKRLLSLGHKIVFVTNSEHYPTEQWLRLKGVPQRVLLVGRKPETPERLLKPHPKILFEGLKALKYEPGCGEPIIVIGDNMSDIEAGVRIRRMARRVDPEALVFTALVLSGGTHPHHATKVNPTHIFADFTDGAKHVEEKFKNMHLMGQHIMVSERARKEIGMPVIR